MAFHNYQKISLRGLGTSFNNISCSHIFVVIVGLHVHVGVHMGPGNYGLFPFYFSLIFWPPHIHFL